MLNREARDFEPSDEELRYVARFSVYGLRRSGVLVLISLSESCLRQAVCCMSSSVLRAEKLEMCLTKMGRSKWSVACDNLQNGRFKQRSHHVISVLTRCVMLYSIFCPFPRGACVQPSWSEKWGFRPGVLGDPSHDRVERRAQVLGDGRVP